uniref:Uncharacterized protein n=1 Tax=Arundo donax TaxID=35708 RepID=A0A0A9CML4_ARUDO
MFHSVAVDGSSSVVPGEGVGEGVGDGGEEDEDDDAEDEDVGGDGQEGSHSRASQLLKRGSSSHANSPKKRHRNPMVKIMNKIQANM